jgi:hypothetical protein
MAATDQNTRMTRALWEARDAATKAPCGYPTPCLGCRPEGFQADDEYDINSVEGQINPRDLSSWDLLLQRTRDRMVVPFIGAGISMPTLPSWCVTRGESSTIPMLGAHTSSSVSDVQA